MNEVILKADRRGRLRYTPEQKQALIEACQSSGLSVKSQFDAVRDSQIVIG